MMMMYRMMMMMMMIYNQHRDAHAIILIIFLQAILMFLCLFKLPSVIRKCELLGGFWPSNSNEYIMWLNCPTPTLMFAK